MGINPSYSIQKLLPLANDLGFCTTESEFDNLFKFNSKEIALKVEKIRQFDEYAIKKYHIYFSRIQELARLVNLEFQHMDLFLIRNKDQKAVKKPFEKNKQFFREQMEITWEYLNILDPKVVLVANATASRILLDEWNNHIDRFSEILGYFEIRLNNGHLIPLLCRGSLTYIDQFTFDDIVRILENALVEEKRQTDLERKISTGNFDPLIVVNGY